jgi:predicted nucleotidyltransferase component of viral defense system
MTPILPLKIKLKKKIHRDIAMAQDLIVIEMYNSFPNIVIHGGTCIWRCYRGNRFSEDIDVYLPVKYKESEELNLFKDNLKKRGFVLEKFKETENSIFSKFSFQNSIVSFEATFKNIGKSVTKTFELSDGNFITVYTLSPEDIIKEKISAYAKRRKIRDLYDIFFMLNFVEDRKAIVQPLRDLIRNFKKPLDLNDLKALLISGAIPSLDEMLRVIEKWEG